MMMMLLVNYGMLEDGRIYNERAMVLNDVGSGLAQSLIFMIEIHWAHKE